MENILGKRLKERRLEKELTLEQVGELVGVKKPAVSKWESGANSPKPETLKKLCDILDCTTDYLTGRTDSPNSVYYSIEYENDLIEMEYDSKIKINQKEFEMFVQELNNVGYDVGALLNKIKKETSKKN